MLETNSLGRAHPKPKSIDVEANLLTEWLVERSTLAARITRRLTLLLGVIAFGAVCLPILDSELSHVQARGTALAKTSGDLDQRLRALQGESSEAKPRLEHEQMLKASRERLQGTLGQLALVFNSAAPGVAISSAKVEILAGEMTISCHADATASASGREFVDKASKGPDTLSAIQSSSHRSDLLGKQGVTFEFVKRIKVGE